MQTRRKKEEAKKSSATSSTAKHKEIDPKATELVKRTFEVMLVALQNLQKNNMHALRTKEKEDWKN